MYFEATICLRNVELCFTHFGLSQLGDDSTTQQSTPIGVVGLSGGVSVSVCGVRTVFLFVS
jgi:hypothetical protein